jgi:glycerol-3-phosphate acyltransferase PlsX
MLARPAFQRLKKKLDYSEYGGAPLLGVQRLVVIGHGSSNARAIRNAVRIVKEFSEHGASDRIEEGIAETHARELLMSDVKVQASGAGD